jgi:hypothetical protein
MPTTAADGSEPLLHPTGAREEASVNSRLHWYMAARLILPNRDESRARCGEQSWTDGESPARRPSFRLVDHVDWPDHSLRIDLNENGPSPCDERPLAGLYPGVTWGG